MFLDKNIHSGVREQVIASGMEHGMRESYQQLTDVVQNLAHSGAAIGSATS